MLTYQKDDNWPFTKNIYFCILWQKIVANDWNIVLTYGDVCYTKWMVNFIFRIQFMKGHIQISFYCLHQRGLHTTHILSEYIKSGSLSLSSHLCTENVCYICVFRYHKVFSRYFNTCITQGVFSISLALCSIKVKNIISAQES